MFTARQVLHIDILCFRIKPQTPTHEAMAQVEKLWKQVKAESAKPNPNREKIDKLKQQMTKQAKKFPDIDKKRLHNVKLL